MFITGFVFDAPEPVRKFNKVHRELVPGVIEENGKFSISWVKLSFRSSGVLKVEFVVWVATLVAMFSAVTVLTMKEGVVHKVLSGPTLVRKHGLVGWVQ